MLALPASRENSQEKAKFIGMLEGAMWKHRPRPSLSDTSPASRCIFCMLARRPQKARAARSGNVRMTGDLSSVDESSVMKAQASSSNTRMGDVTVCSEPTR